MMIDYVKRLKHCGWDDPNEILSPDIVLQFIDEITKELDIKKLHQESYLNDLFAKIQKKLMRQHKVKITKALLCRAYQKLVSERKISKNPQFESMTLLRPTRSNSGELEVTTILPGYSSSMSCKFNCTFCPNQPGMARSYLSSEGTPQLGVIENFCAIGETLRRIIQLQWTMNHQPDKILHIILGGTFHSYEPKLLEEYITGLYYACNIYHYFDRYDGEYRSIVEEWFQSQPFLNHRSVKDGKLGEILKTIRPMKSLAEEKEINTFGKYGRITGIVIETRPDQIGLQAISDLRKYGVTRVQLGIQHTDNTILKINNRGHTVEASKKAIKLLRDNGFKVDCHVMPDLPGSNDEKDIKMYEEVYEDEDIQPDYSKNYICLDLPFTEIRKWKEFTELLLSQGKIEDVKYISSLMQTGDIHLIDKFYEQKGYQKGVYVWLSRAEHDYENFLTFLVKGIQYIRPWTRLNRFQRDFPKASVKNEGIGYESLNLVTNQQQICMDLLKSKGLRSYDIRSREIRKRIFTDIDDKIHLYFRKYRANQGTEFFISVEIPSEEFVDLDDSVILGFIRLRIPDWDMQKATDSTFTKKSPYWTLKTFKNKTTLLVRELHVYGNLQSHNQIGNSQHRGIGKFLMQIAEYVAVYYNMQQIVVISGVGVQDYYRNRGYEKNSVEEGEYMVKSTFSTKVPAKLISSNYTYSDIESVLKGKPRFLVGCKKYNKNGELFVIKKYTFINYKITITIIILLGLLSLLILICVQ